MALLAADKLAAVADAKLAAIENCIQEEEMGPVSRTIQKRCVQGRETQN